MRSVFAWLLMFGVIAGLCGRVLALDHVHSKVHTSQCSGHDHDGHDHDHESTDDHSHEGCPPGPHEHHTHACCHPAPLAGMDLQQHRMPPPGAVWLCVSWVTALPPDEPVFALDKPPLI
ncbi:hypothetical protein OKA04_18570 [Luteolibacter flavescens]|uniref:Cobalt transporter n=1 Tax=Luteolibacter flavescens TaxID=1859460 RepID=A0ABT3FUT2_9BACT|nr:hypothetical protein [Luteolibacter flavescens]MCW1886750.1 hypothetical protein [Luteolibacter flavescens]